MVESHCGGSIDHLEVDWFGAAAGGVPPFDGNCTSCRYDTGRRRPKQRRTPRAEGIQEILTVSEPFPRYRTALRLEPISVPSEVSYGCVQDPCRRGQGHRHQQGELFHRVQLAVWAERMRRTFTPPNGHCDPIIGLNRAFWMRSSVWKTVGYVAGGRIDETAYLECSY